MRRVHGKATHGHAGRGGSGPHATGTAQRPARGAEFPRWALTLHLRDPATPSHTLSAARAHDMRRRLPLLLGLKLPVIREPGRWRHLHGFRLLGWREGYRLGPPGLVRSSPRHRRRRSDRGGGLRPEMARIVAQAVEVPACRNAIDVLIRKMALQEQTPSCRVPDHAEFFPPTPLSRH